MHLNTPGLYSPLGHDALDHNPHLLIDQLVMLVRGKPVTDGGGEVLSAMAFPIQQEYGELSPRMVTDQLLKVGTEMIELLSG
jgi:hypothetical protein